MVKPDHGFVGAYPRPGLAVRGYPELDSRPDRDATRSRPGGADSACEWVRLNLSLRRFGLVNSLLQSSSGLIPRPLVDLSAVTKQNHVGNRSDVVSRAQPLFFVDVDDQDRQTSSIVSGELLKFRIDSSAWTAPLGAELYQHQTSRHLTIEFIF